MMTDDEVYGVLNYQYQWIGYRNIEFLGEITEIALLIGGEENGEFED